MNDQTLSPCPCCQAPALLVEDADFFSLGCSVGDCRAHGLYTTEPSSQLDQALAAWRRRAQPEASDDEIFAGERQLVGAC
jgi:hypothetical protein